MLALGCSKDLEPCLVLSSAGGDGCVSSCSSQTAGDSPGRGDSRTAHRPQEAKWKAL